MVLNIKDDLGMAMATFDSKNDVDLVRSTLFNYKSVEIVAKWLIKNCDALIVEICNTKETPDQRHKYVIIEGTSINI